MKTMNLKNFAVLGCLAFLAACGGGNSAVGVATPNVVNTNVQPTSDLSSQATVALQNAFGNVRVNISQGLIYDGRSFNGNNQVITINANSYTWAQLYSQFVVPMIQAAGCQVQSPGNLYGNSYNLGGATPPGSMSSLNWSCINALQNTFANDWSFIYVNFASSQNQYRPDTNMAWVINQFFTTASSALNNVYPVYYSSYYNGYNPSYMMNSYAGDPRYTSNSFYYNVNNNNAGYGNTGNYGSVSLYYGR